MVNHKMDILPEVSFMIIDTKKLTRKTQKYFLFAMYIVAAYENPHIFSIRNSHLMILTSGPLEWNFNETAFTFPIFHRSPASTE